MTISFASRIKNRKSYGFIVDKNINLIPLYVTMNPYNYWLALPKVQRLLLFLLLFNAAFSFFYATAKIVGWINTPFWIQMAPVFSDGVSVVIISILLGMVLYDNRHIKRELRNLELRLEKLSRLCSQKFSDIDNRFADVDKHLAVIESKLKI